MRVKFDDMTQKKTLWENPALSFSDEYELASAASILLAGYAHSSIRSASPSIGCRRTSRAPSCRRFWKRSDVKPADVRKQIAVWRDRRRSTCSKATISSRGTISRSSSPRVVDEGLQAFNVQSFYANEATHGRHARSDDRRAPVGRADAADDGAAPRACSSTRPSACCRRGKAKDEEPEAPAPAAADKKRRKILTPAEELEQYFETPEPMTTLVFVAGALDANRRLVKLLRKHGVTVDCGSLDSAADASRWIQQRLEKDNLTIEPKAVALLLESTGLSLGRIRARGRQAGAVRGGRANGDGGSRSRRRDPVGRAVGGTGGRVCREGRATRSERSTNWRHSSRAARRYLPILGQIRWAAGQLRPDDRARRALNLILETDLAIKSSGGEPRYLLERLVIELCARS